MHINFEEDKKEVLDMSTDNDKKSLSDQVEKLKDLEDSIVAKEEELKQLKQQADAISGEVIPTMMQELNISTLKLADGSAVEVKPVYGASISPEKKRRSI
jgi:predicted  nucleic acid-binding Zn-ribbon protein